MTRREMLGGFFIPIIPTIPKDYKNGECPVCGTLNDMPVRSADYMFMPIPGHQVDPMEMIGCKKCRNVFAARYK